MIRRVARGLALAAALSTPAACKGDRQSTAPAEPVETPAAVTGGPLNGRRQLITITTDRPSASEGTLELWRRAENGPWQRADVWEVTLGPNGLAWGIGLHGKKAPPGLSGPKKKEGDGKTPEGLFEIGGAYGYQPQAKTRLPYTQVKKSWRCVDDPESEHYGEILDADENEVDWSSAETMRRRDPLYRWVLAVAHNPKRIPGRGSCIFFHVWSGPEASTSGCAAMPETRMRSLFGWLDPKARPAVAILSQTAYSILRPRWGLP